MVDQTTATPTVRDMQVIPVAGYDSMLLNLCGAHAPYFTRNLVVLKDSAGRTGIGEVPGGEGIRQALERTRSLVIGQPVGRYNRILNQLRHAIAGNGQGPQATRHEVTSEAEAAVLKQPHEINLRLDNVITAVEAALLDLLGQHLEVPVADLLGNASSATACRCWPTSSTSATVPALTCPTSPATAAATTGTTSATRRP